jgi:RimJ/RimL family protein N-acetyltransferase
VGYWLGKPFWGQGIATAALRALLLEVRNRPLYARVAKDNLASLAVLTKGGFTVIGEDIGFANARGQEIEEWLLRLD